MIKYAIYLITIKFSNLIFEILMKIPQFNDEMHKNVFRFEFFF